MLDKLESLDDIPSQTGIEIYERAATAEEDDWACKTIHSIRRDAQVSGWVVLALLLSMACIAVLSQGGRGLAVFDYVASAIILVPLAVFLVWATNTKRLRRAFPSHNFMMIVRLRVEEALWVETDGMIIRCEGDRGLVMTNRRGDLRSAEIGLTRRFPGEFIQLEYYFRRTPNWKKPSSSGRDRKRTELIRNQETGYLRAIRTMGQGPAISINTLLIPRSCLLLVVDPAVPVVDGQVDLYVYEPDKKRAVKRNWVLRDLRVAISDVRDMDLGPVS